VPLVYVHGIANRADRDGYEPCDTFRDQLFRRFLLPANGDAPTDAIGNPYWGRFAGNLRWDGSSFPATRGSTGEFLGVEDLGLAVEAVITEPASDPNRLLLGIAQRDLSDVVDLLYSVGPHASYDLAAQLAECAGDLVTYFDERERAVFDVSDGLRYPWLEAAKDDADLLDLLLSEVATKGAVGSLGTGDAVLDWLTQARNRLRHGAAVVGGAPGAAAVGLLRAGMPSLTAKVIGDIFAYLGCRGEADAPGPIIECVAEDLEKASRARAPGSPLTVVAHSLGGVIAYDVLSYYRPDIVVDRLVTVGSQVGLFEELGLFRASDPALQTATQPRVDPPANVRHWLNVVDHADPLAFRAEPIFQRVVDYAYPSAALWAHGAYLRQPRFHRRLADRLAQLPA
jgi:hypothetical protein